MTAVRAALIAGIVFLLAASPLLIPAFGGAAGSKMTAYAARPTGLDAGSIALANKNANDNNDNNSNGNDNNNNGNDNNNNGNDNNNNGNDNNNNGNDNNNNGNGNDNNGNGNGNGNDNNGNGNGNGNGNESGIGFQGGAARGGRGGGSVTGTNKCFDVQEVGLIQRSFGDGDVTVSVPPDAGFSAITRLSLNSASPSSVPAPPAGATLLDSLVWTLDAQSGCSGPAIVPLPGGVNLGITYRVAADKSKVRIVYLQGGSWTTVTTVPDPNPSNPYVSATITNAGTYALVQVP